jgi:hypothetical protein
MFDRLKSLLDEILKPEPAATTSLSPNHRNVERGAALQVVAPPPIATARNEPLHFDLISGGVMFSVDDVVPASHPLWQGSLAESTEIRAEAKILLMPDGEAPALAPEGYVRPRTPGEAPRPLRTVIDHLSATGPGSIAQQLAKSQTFLHPLVQAVHLAFSQHRPLILSPDCIWLTIVQGFGHHINENAEALRDRMVRHSGKKKLEVKTDSLAPSLWPGLISQFSAQIRENSDPVLHETLVCEFSTTTPNIKTAYEVALMDTYQRYFDYEMMCLCGIPKITVKGTAEDWQRIRERIEVLATYDLGWWTSRLEPILDQFVATAKGNADHSFWQAIYKPQKAYAAELASGWIADLFPYLFGAPPASRPMGSGLCAGAAARRNHVLSTPREDWLLPVPSSPMAGNGVKLQNFPSGLSRAPVKLTLPDRAQMQLELLGGFLGVAQGVEDNALAPVVSWAVVQKS